VREERRARWASGACGERSLSEHEQKLIGLGFVAGGDGILRAPVGSVITLKPIAQSYYELKIGIGGNVLSCIVPAAALKIAPPSEAVVDVDTLIVSTVRRRPW